MPDYSYTALGNTGQRSNGTLTANSEREVMTMLDARGLFPLKIEAIKGLVAAKSGGKRIKGKYLAMLFSQLADLLRAGVSLLRALETLEKQVSHPALGEMLREVRAKVADGTSLADALAEHPRAFNELTISMVRAGQEGGFLEDVLERIAQFTEHQEDLRAKVIGAMAYPVFLAVTGFVILNVLVLFFVPRFKPIFAKLEEKRELPWLTTALMSTSELFLRNIIAFLAVVAFLAIIPFFSVEDFQDLGIGRGAGSRKLSMWGAIRALIVILALSMPAVLLLQEDYAAAVLLGVFLAGLLRFKFWAASEKGRYAIDRFRLRLPQAGTIYLNLALARFARILGTLLHSGIPILQGMRIAKDSTGNMVLSRAIEEAAENLTQGEKLAAPLGASPHIPKDIVEMVAVGEESNQLEKVLLDIANGLEKRTARQLELFVRLLEPVMLLVMALITLVVVAGLLMPVFKMSSVVS
jgi:general secretion pathway protein F/type IV pilus assembly protein PilC